MRGGKGHCAHMAATVCPSAGFLLLDSEIFHAKIEEDMMQEKVGFMGLGIMGLAMARNIAMAGYSLSLYNRSTEKVKALALSAGKAKIAKDPKTLAEESDIIIAMVTGPEALNELLWGPEGAAAALSKDKIFINMSTVSPAFVNELKERLALTHVTFIDAPVSGSKKPAEDATLVILASGPKEKVDQLMPLFETMGKKTVYCGEVGKGSMMKLSINLLLGVMMEGLSEALNLAKMGGLSVESFLDVVYSGPMNCGLFQMKADSLRQGEFTPSFPLKHMAKDLKFAVDTAYEIGATLPVGHALLNLYQIGVGRKWGDLDFSAILNVLEHENAVDKP